MVVLVAGFPYRLLIKPEEGEVKAGRPDISVPTEVKVDMQGSFSGWGSCC